MDPRPGHGADQKLEAMRREIEAGGVLIEVTPDIASLQLSLVNVIFLGVPGGPWTLVDCGITGDSQRAITNAAEKRFGANAKPASIILTHGHSDHTGALLGLTAEWNVPVYAAEAEHPYLNGMAAYPPPDASVMQGVVSPMALLYSAMPFDVSAALQALPLDGSVPGLPDWQWLHTPGHTPGHACLWRPKDRTLITGDAFVATSKLTSQEILNDQAHLFGPPANYTQNWPVASRSIKRLADLEPQRIITGHGKPIEGPRAAELLHHLAERFDREIVPPDGVYVRMPLSPEDGSAYYPVEHSR